MDTPACRPLLIGSLPLRDHDEATRLIFEHCPEVPLWPQLPQLPGEGMIRQFLSGFPGLVEDGKKFWVEATRESFPEEMAAFYEDLMQAEADAPFFATSRFALGTDTAPGFQTFIRLLKSSALCPYALKGQVTGPVTTGIGTRDQNGRAIFYDDNLRDMLVKLLAGKGKWQAVELSKCGGESPPIIFIDEPGMVSFGSSAFTGVTVEMVSAAVGEVIEAIHQGGGLAGIHICANGDWGPALSCPTDIISFDAYSYFDNIILFREPLLAFLHRGGFLAWGIVPTGDPEAVARESAESLFTLWQEQVLRLSTLGIDPARLLRQTFITPACGTGSLTLEMALKVLGITRELSHLARRHLQSI